MLAAWCLLSPSALASEEAATVHLRHWEAVSAGHGLSVSLVGMSVVFVGLTVLFLTMVLLRRLLDPRERIERGPMEPLSAAEGEPEPLDPRVAAAITLALQLELRRRTCAAAAQGADATTARGWLTARGGQWAAQQHAYARSRR